ncbi:DNA polymerase-4 [Luteococcus japonicus]|uniref:DNA polymerase IV n=1 Tax=Luteococcus japonicus TaxID=33984 RepID=A0A3N1ZXL2_9ACTN|nr:DNA polymerase IV [Luteococcus japonicus]ROR55593.1 DNA polymerase-4 [Luteococcus japonicus]
MNRVILHVDMDAFYASVEMARRPELRGRPMYVGGAHRGVVLSANYEARRYGIEGGMSSTRARRLCPQAVAVPPDFDAYQVVSHGVFAIFETVTAQVEAASIDEAFLDITGALRRLGDPVMIGERLRAQVADEQQVPCSVGIGPSKFVAKLASKQAKPDGLVLVRPQEVLDFLHPLPVEAMWGVGPSTAGRLHKLGLLTVADLAHTPRATLQRAFGANQGGQLHDLAWGRDARRVVPEQTERSIGAQETFARDTDDAAMVRTEILRLSGRVASRMRRARMLGRVVCVEVRFADFSTTSRTITLDSLTDVTDEVFDGAWRAFGRLKLQRARIRRVGVRVEGLVEADQAFQQLPLDAPERGMREVELVADEVVNRFGPAAVQRASLTRR